MIKITYTLNSINLGKVQSEKINKTSGLEIIEGIFEDSSENLISDFSAPKREITVTGIYTELDGTLATFISNINSIIDGTQDDSVVYNSDLSGAINVFVMSWDYNYTAGNVEFIDYSIKLIEGKPL